MLVVVNEARLALAQLWWWLSQKSGVSSRVGSTDCVSPPLASLVLESCEWDIMQTVPRGHEGQA